MSSDSPGPIPSPEQRRRLLELARLFLRLGATTFGGPAVHVAVMEEEVVRRRAWLSSAEFLDLLGATQLIPGPNSTELAIYVGQRRAGGAGLVVAGLCFILPAALFTAILAQCYVAYGRLPQAEAILAGIRPVILAIVAQAVWRLSRPTFKSGPLAAVGLAVAGLAWLGVHELVLLFGSGLLLLAFGKPGKLTPLHPPPPDPAPKPTRAPLLFLPLSVAAPALGPVALGPLFLTFLKAGTFLFGSGYVLLAFLRADLVDRLGWLTEAQLLDAIVAGQATPGTVFSTATFVGYILAGLPGAALATLGIFLPAFVFVALSGRFIPRLRASPRTSSFLDGVNVASLALMATVALRIGLESLRSGNSIALALLSTVLLLRFRLNPTWLILGGGVAGYALDFGAR